jgi:hypothetical protein
MRPAAQQMKVQVIHRLPTVRSCIGDKTKSTVQPKLFCQLANHQQQMSGE